MKHALIIALFCLSSSTAMAQYVGKSAIPVMTIKQLLDTGMDDQHVTLRGKILSHNGGKRFTFADDSGKLAVKISPRLFPSGQPIDASTLVEIMGEFDKNLIGESKLEVKQIKVLP